MGDLAGAGGADQPVVVDGRSMAVLYGSETGSAEDIAIELGKMTERLRFQTTVDEMDGFKLVRCFLPPAMHSDYHQVCSAERNLIPSSQTTRLMSCVHRWSSLSRRRRARATCPRTRSSSGRTSGARSSTTQTALGRCGLPSLGWVTARISSTSCIRYLRVWSTLPGLESPAALMPCGRQVRRCFCP